MTLHRMIGGALSAVLGMVLFAGTSAPAQAAPDAASARAEAQNLDIEPPGIWPEPERIWRIGLVPSYDCPLGRAGFAFWDHCAGRMEGQSGAARSRPPRHTRAGRKGRRCGSAGHSRQIGRSLVSDRGQYLEPGGPQRRHDRGEHPGQAVSERDIQVATSLIQAIDDTLQGEYKGHAAYDGLEVECS